MGGGKAFKLSTRQVFTIAAVSAAVFSICIILFVWSEESRRQTDRESAASAEAEYSETKSSCINLSVPEEIYACAQKQIAASRSDKRAHYDLQAQQDVATYAKGTFWIALLGMLISAGGLAALYHTFLEQRRLTQTQSRAYIEVVTGRVTVWKNGQWFAEISYMNTGQTPAFDVEIKLIGKFHWLAVEGRKSRDPFVAGYEYWNPIVGPSAIDTARPWFDRGYPLEIITGLGNHKGEIISTTECVFPFIEIEGEIVFKDAFGDTRKTEIHLKTFDIVSFDTYPLQGGSERIFEQTVINMRHEPKESDRP